jgi:hypothetical protein
LGLSSLFVEKLDDSSAAVRKASLDGLKALRDLDSPEAKAIGIDQIESLKERNPRAYKAISGDRLKEVTKPAPKNQNASAVTQPAHADKADPPRKVALKSQVIPDATRASEDGRAISLDRALTCASSLRIPLWDAPEDDAGVLAGLRCKFAVRPSNISS